MGNSVEGSIRLLLGRVSEEVPQKVNAVFCWHDINRILSMTRFNENILQNNPNPFSLCLICKKYSRLHEFAFAIK